MASKYELKQQAEELGLDLDVTLTKAEIEAEIDAALGAEPAAVGGVKNAHTAPFMVCGHRIMPGGVYQPTEAEQKNVRMIKRMENAILKGYLERV